MSRRAGIEWQLPDGTLSYEAAQLAVLMDIRYELQRLNAIFQCANFTQLPRVIRRISANTAKPRPKKKTRV